MLLQNGTLNAQYPFRLCGGVMSGDVQMSRRGDRINRLAGLDSALAGEPSGALAPLSWNLPRRAGLAASYAGNTMVLAGTATGASGRNGVADGAGVLSGAATGTALASGSGTTAAALTGAATATGAASGTATGAAALTGAGTASAPGSATATGTATLTGAVTPGAIGWAQAGPEVTGLTEDAIATAVWAALASANNTPGSMGELLNTAAAAAGIDADTVADAVWDWADTVQPGSKGEELAKALKAAKLAAALSA